MNPLAEPAARTVLIGMGATLFMDAWLLLLQRLKVPTLDFAFIGRWVVHGVRGRWRHEAIAKAPAVRGELAWGWATTRRSGPGGSASTRCGMWIRWAPSWCPASCCWGSC